MAIDPGDSSSKAARFKAMVEGGAAIVKYLLFLANLILWVSASPIPRSTFTNCGCITWHFLEIFQFQRNFRSQVSR